MPVAEITTTLQEAVGDALQAVAIYDGGEIDIRYLRSDIERQLDDDGIDRIRENTVLEAVGSVGISDVFLDVGTHEATVHQFDRAIVVNVPTSDTSGVFVSVDADADARVRTLIEACRSAAA
jgi:hypothetical protein